MLCLVEGEVPKVIDELHSCVWGGNYSWKVTTHKILKGGFYWTKLFRYAYAQVRTYKKC